jgi:hypothetical protein
MTGWRRLSLIVVVFACVRPGSPPNAPTSGIPGFMRGEFVDDYGGRHSITSADWLQRPRNRFHIVRWTPQQRYLVAQNDSGNPDGGGRWTRIDWVLIDTPPYTWAFCFSAYDAPSLAAAESVSIARPETPRTGCNRYPYTRMRAATESR